jgi:hypothetical protein
LTYFFTFIFMLLVFWRPQEWLATWLYGWPLLDAVVGLSLGALMIEANEGRLRLPIELPQIFMLAGLWAAAPISHIPHTYFAGMIGSILPVFKICFFTLLLFIVLDRTSRLRTMAWLFVAMACFMAVHSYLQQRRGYGFAGAWPVYIPPIGDAPGYHASRFYGIFADPNDLGQFFVSCIPLAFCLTRHRTLHGFLLGCGISAFLLTALAHCHSRGAMVGLAAVVATFVLTWLPDRWFPIMLALGMVAALGMCPFAGAFLDESARDRVVFWGFANYIFKRNPIFGLGYGMFWQVVPKSRAAHNAFVSCYTELGLLGYWFWFGLIQLGVISAWKTRLALKDVQGDDAVWLKRFARYSLCAMMGFCGSSYFLSRTFLYPMFFFMAMLGVLPVVARRYLPEEKLPHFDFRKDVLLMVSLGSLGSVIYIYVSILLLNRAWGG